MKIILIIIVLVISSVVNAQYNLHWYASYDNPHPSYTDFAVDLVGDNLGNTYVTGTSFQMDLTDDWRYDFATIKYNSNGDSLWVKRYDSSIGNENEDRAEVIGIDGQNNIYVSGNSYGWGGGISATIIKYDADGNQIWVRNYYDTTLTILLKEYDMVVDNGGNVYLLCSRNGNSSISEIIKYNTNGNLEWVSKYYMGTNDVNNLISLTLDTYGNVYATGCTRDSGTIDRDYLTVKYNPAGILQWTARTNQTTQDIGHCIRTDNSGNVYVAGYSKTNGSKHDFKLLKYNSAGEEVWVRSYNGRWDIDGFQTYGKNKMIVLDGLENVYVNFMTYSITNYTDIATAKYDSSGELKWINEYNIEEVSGWDENRDIKIDNNNNVYVTGISKFNKSNNSFVILRYDSSGVLKNEVKNNNQFPNIFLPAALIVNDDGDITATGSGHNNWSYYVTDYFTVKYSNTIGINTISNSIPSIFNLHQNYPNPFNPTTNIKYEISKSGNVTLKIFNVLGKEIITLVNKNQNTGIYEASFDGSNLSGGVYFYVLESDSFSETKKMIILK